MPKRKPRGAKAPKVAVQVSVSKAPGNPTPGRRQRRRPGAASSLTSLFLKSQLNPFQYGPPLLGYGSFIPANKAVLWARQFGLSHANATCAAVVFNPTAESYNSAPINGGPPCWLRTTFGDAPNVSIATSAAIAGHSFPSLVGGEAAFRSRGDSFRMISAGVRVTVRYPMTSTPGRLFALPMYESDASVAALSFNDFTNLADARPLAFDGSGVAAVQCNSRWPAVDDLEFRPVPETFSVTTILQKCVIVAIGWPMGFMLDVEAIGHAEYQSGIVASGDSGYGPTVALETSIEALGAAIRRVPSVLDHHEILACQRTALVSAMGLRQNGAPSGLRAAQRFESASAASSGSGSDSSTLADMVYDYLPDTETVARTIARTAQGLAAARAAQAAQALRLN